MTAPATHDLTPYLRQAREHPSYRWWRLPLAGLISVPAYLVSTIAVLGGAYLVAPHSVDQFMNSADADFNVGSPPAVLLLGLVSVAVLLPVVRVAVLITGPRPVGHLSSVYGRLRWRWLMQTSVAALLVMFGTLLLLTLVIDRTPIEIPTQRMQMGIIVAVVATPFQAAAEEYVFRGYLLQLVGSWTRSVWLPVAVSVPLFAAAHGYSHWGTVDVAIFGLTASILVVRTGGLEASIALHAANNISLDVLEAFGLVDTSDKGMGPMDVVPTLVTSLVFIALVEVMFRRSRLFRARRRAVGAVTAPIG